MNQTKKRLAIIKLAISMTDTETIQLQVLKLGLLKTDSKMREILVLLNEHNYAQAQRLISAYIESPLEPTVIQRTSQEETPTIPEPTPEEAMIERPESTVADTVDEKPLSLKEKIQQAKEKALIDQFELFSVTSEEQEDTTDIPSEEYDDYLDIAPKPKKMSTESINYDALLNVDAQDVLPDNIVLDISNDTDIPPTEEEFFNEELHILPHIQEDDFFSPQEESSELFTSEKPQEVAPLEIPNKEKPQDIPDEEETQESFENTNTRYKAISYIDQKYKNMSNQYPPLDSNNTEYPSARAWLLQISNEGYTESDVEEMIKHIEKLAKTDKAEAAQLLLITAATESKYAQFRLARALYRGEMLEKNLPEAFTLINRLAMNDNYPEAICDLAQFYENGVGISKDKQKAIEFYKEAMDLGIQRAADHYERLSKNNKGLFSFLKK